MVFDDFNKVFGEIFYKKGFDMEMVDAIFYRHLRNVTNIVKSDFSNIYKLEDIKSDNFTFLVDKEELYGVTEDDLLSNENAKYLVLNYNFTVFYIENDKLIVEKIKPLKNDQMFIKAECYEIEEINKLLEGKNSSIGSEHLVYLLDKLIPQLKVTVIVDKPTCQMNSRVTENGVLVDDFKKEVSINPYAAAYRHFTNLLKVYNENKKTKKRK